MEGRDQEWRKNADTTKMSPEEVRRAGVEDSKRPPGSNPGGILHQRRRLPYSLPTIVVAGSALVGAMWYLTLYTKKKPETTARDVAKVSTGLASPEETGPRKVDAATSVAGLEETRPRN